MCVLLSTDTNGFLNYELVEKGIAHSVSSNCSSSHDPGLAAIFVEANPTTSLKKLESSYTAALKKFPAWLSKERLESVKLYFITSEWESLRNPMSLAQKISTTTTLSGNPLYSFEFIQKVQKVTKDDILNIFDEWKKRGHTRIFLQPQNKSSLN
jgi:predicted Zn-dependent peptidase